MFSSPPRMKSHVSTKFLPRQWCRKPSSSCCAAVVDKRHVLSCFGKSSSCGLWNPGQWLHRPLLSIHLLLGTISASQSSFSRFLSHRINTMTLEFASREDERCLDFLLSETKEETALPSFLLLSTSPKDSPKEKQVKRKERAKKASHDSPSSRESSGGPQKTRVEQEEGKKNVENTPVDDQVMESVDPQSVSRRGFSPDTTSEEAKLAAMQDEIIKVQEKEAAAKKQDEEGRRKKYEQKKSRRKAKDEELDIRPYEQYSAMQKRMNYEAIREAVRIQRVERKPHVYQDLGKSSTDFVDTGITVEMFAKAVGVVILCVSLFLLNFSVVAGTWYGILWFWTCED